MKVILILVMSYIFTCTLYYMGYVAGQRDSKLGLNKHDDWGNEDRFIP